MLDVPIISELRAALRRRGVWGSRAERLMQEWTEHVHDDAARRVEKGAALNAAQEAAWKALGAPDTLATSAARELAKTSWLGRHPWLAGLMPPVIIWIVALIAVLYTPTMIARLGGVTTQNQIDPAMLRTGIVCWQHMFNWLPWLLSTAWLARIAIRMPGGWKLFWITFAVVTVCSTSTWLTIIPLSRAPGWQHIDISVAGIFGLFVSALTWAGLGNPDPSPWAPPMAQTVAWIQTAVLMLGALAFHFKATATSKATGTALPG